MSTAAALGKEKIIMMAKVGQPVPDFNMASTKNMETLAENVKLSDYKDLQTGGLGAAEWKPGQENLKV